MIMGMKGDPWILAALLALALTFCMGCAGAVPYQTAVAPPGGALFIDRAARID